MSSCAKMLKLLEQHRDRFRALGVKRLGLFGSAARDQISQDSDLDFVVDFEKKSFDTYMDLKFYLDILSADVRRLGGQHEDVSAYLYPRCALCGSFGF